MLTLQEINAEMSALNGWSLEANSITKDFSFVDFKEALGFVNKVGETSEKLNHHPDIMMSYNKVRLALTTHSLSGLSKLDFQLAREIDKIDISLK